MRRTIRLALSAAATAFAAQLPALPIGPVVLQGTASFLHPDAATLVVQASPGATISWESFAIGPGETVNVVLPASGATVVNLAAGAQPAALQGRLASNGALTLTAAGGIVATSGSQIDAGSLVLNAPGANIALSGGVNSAGALSATANEILIDGVLDVGGNMTLTASGTVTVSGGAAVGGPIIGSGGAVITNTSGAAIAISGGGSSGNVTLSSGSTAFAPELSPGWNLLGNSLAGALGVAAMVGAPGSPIAGVTGNIESVWKWNAASARWALYSPRLGATELAAFAAAHGHDVLDTIGPSQGFWILSAAAFTLPPQVGVPVDIDAPGFSGLPAGFNLISTGSQRTPSEFRDSVGAFTSLWAWDAVLQRWYFHSPELEATGGLAAVRTYAESHGFLHFADRNRKLGIGVGFWVAK